MENPGNSFEERVWEDGRYPLQAYEFLHEGLKYTTRRCWGDVSSTEPRHVTGQQLAEGLRDYAIERWGALAPVVLRHWNIRSTLDFGKMVFFLVEMQLMGKQDSDRLEDFADVYDFDDAFADYVIPVEQAYASGAGE
ncbi:MAG: hypothetical protein D6744_17620 [Planctomycetota bacterium]|nr:MAG: hypothetical protein D6744_17620 [Planctomycetota bacterium]